MGDKIYNLALEMGRRLVDPGSESRMGSDRLKRGGGDSLRIRMDVGFDWLTVPLGLENLASNKQNQTFFGCCAEQLGNVIGAWPHTSDLLQSQVLCFGGVGASVSPTLWSHPISCLFCKGVGVSVSPALNCTPLSPSIQAWKIDS